MEKLTKSFIKERSNIEFYEKGNAIFKRDKITKIDIEQSFDGVYLKGTVEVKNRNGLSIFYPSVFANKENIEQFTCSCFEGRIFSSCEHLVALLLKIEQQWDTFSVQINKPRLTEKTRNFLEYFNSVTTRPRVNSQEVIEKYELVPIFCIDTKEFQICWLEFKVLTPKAYKVRNIPYLVNSYKKGTSYEVSSKTKLCFKDSFQDSMSKSLIEFIADRYMDESEIQSWNYSELAINSFKKTKKFPLTKMRLQKFFEIMQDEQFEIHFTHNVSKKPALGRFLKQRPTVNVAICKKNDEVEIVFNDAEKSKIYYGLDDDFEFIYFDGNIYNVDTEFAQNIKPLSRYQTSSDSNYMLLPESQIETVFTSVFPKLGKIAEIQTCEILGEKYYKADLDARLYFDKFNSGISVRINFCYDDIIINPLSSKPFNLKLGDKVLIRDEEKEKYIVEILKSSGFKKMSDVIVLVEEKMVYDFLTNILPELKKITKVYYSEDFKRVKLVNSPSLKAKARLNSEGSLLEMNFDYGDIDPKELKDVLSSYKIKKKYHRLKDGSFVSLESDEIKVMADVFEQLNLSPQQIASDKIQLPKYRAIYLDALAKEEASFALTRGMGVKKLVQDICETSDLDYEIPNGITGELRDYQKVGFSWLKSLAKNGLGGILADDMGLGKTLQVIAFIMSEKQDENFEPSLVIAPSSLLYNWEEEVKKFAPTLNVKIVAGTVSERKEIIKDLSGFDIVVTSYGMAKKDVTLYEDRNFKYCFIDEAQHIKNPNTLNAKSVKKIKANAYFALTGTPIENSLTELWSIFDFLMPAYLSSHKKFSNRFEIPIIKQKDETAMENLKRHIRPFILRRLKKDVLKELPPKNEIRTTNEMTKEQQKIYLAYLEEAKESIAKEIKEKGFEKSQIKILSILTRLRQICCHPSTFIENYKGGSGKLEIFNQLIGDLKDSGHRILVFSQFTSMLSIIKKELDQTQKTYFSLDGSTPSQERMRMVNAFNKGERDLFLLSLKAGGTGLNLTGADVVVHFDPWWNPAVEEQASDRAYRIGQENSVSVYKLITKNSIEEKIFNLQLRKKELIDAIINPGENFLTKMTPDEIKGLFEME